MKTEKEIFDKMDGLNEKINNLRTNTSELGKKNFEKFNNFNEILEWVLQ